MKNPFYYIFDKSPRAWAILSFFPLLAVTICVFPLVYVYEVVVSILESIWDAIVCSPFVCHAKIGLHIVSVVWKNWYVTLLSGKNAHRKWDRD